MKKYKIVFLPSAKQDLSDIVDYLSQFYASTAVKKYDRIIEKIALLQDMPYMCEEYTLHSTRYNYRKMIVDEYLVFYVVLEDTVEIHSIINGKLNIMNIIQ